MEKDLINTAYRAALTSTFTVDYSMLLKKFFSMSIGPPSTMSAEVFKLVIPITLSEFRIEYLIKQKIIPAVIIPPARVFKITTR